MTLHCFPAPNLRVQSVRQPGNCRKNATSHVTRSRNLSDKPSPEPSYDFAALGNLCVDVFVENYSPLPLPPDVAFRRKLWERLLATPSGTYRAEVGGNMNTMIAAARLGLRVASVGHLGTDANGRFLEQVMREERIARLQRVIESAQASSSQPTLVRPDPSVMSLEETLVCFVLCDDQGRHAFCSRFDFGPWPFLAGLTELPPAALQVLARTRSLFLNGFVLDELHPELVLEASRTVREKGGFSFFDPGPRVGALLTGSPRMQEAFWELVLRSSSCLVMTQEEGQQLAGKGEPEEIAQFLFDRAFDGLEWVVVKLGARGAVLFERGTLSGKGLYGSPFRVDVVDTVGCGDSFAAALALGRSKGLDVPTTLTLANAVGAVTATRRGAGRNVATADLVKELLKGRVVDQRDESAQSALDSISDAVEGDAFAASDSPPSVDLLPNDQLLDGALRRRASTDKATRA